MRQQRPRPLGPAADEAVGPEVRRVDDRIELRPQCGQIVADEHVLHDARAVAPHRSDHVVDAGLSFAVDTKKEDFIGRDAVLRRKETGPKMRMVQFLLNDAEPLLYHYEPIVRDGEIVGYISSGSFGHHLGGAVGLGYVPCAGESAADVLASSYEIEVAGTRVGATASLKPLYDPQSTRMRDV